MQGTLTVAVIRWQEAPETALPRLAAAGDVAGLHCRRNGSPRQYPNFADRLVLSLDPGPRGNIPHAAGPPPLPATSPAAPGAMSAFCKSRVSVPLTAATRLTWRWRIDALAVHVAGRYRSDSRLSEHRRRIRRRPGPDLLLERQPAPGHDLPLPVADVEAPRNAHGAALRAVPASANGLPNPGCCRPTTSTAIGTPPARIVAVWLIANSLFQRRTGRCEYADITIETPDEIVAVS
ncbi:MAG: hypothetical protein WDN04_12800 [Rhodospirillales bacterium]